MRVKFGNGTKDVPILEVNAANYIVPEGEEGSYHVRQEITNFDQRTGRRLSVPRIQKYGAKEFKAISRILRQQGYELTILHDPTDYLKQKEEEAENRRMMTVQKQRELEQKRREAEKAALKEEIMMELKEAGIIPPKGGKTEENPEPLDDVDVAETKKSGSKKK